MRSPLYLLAAVTLLLALCSSHSTALPLAFPAAGAAAAALVPVAASTVPPSGPAQAPNALTAFKQKLFGAEGRRLTRRVSGKSKGQGKAKRALTGPHSARRMRAHV